MVFMQEFLKKVDFEKNKQQATKSTMLQNYPVGKDLTEKLVTPYTFLFKIPVHYTMYSGNPYGTIHRMCSGKPVQYFLNWHTILCVQSPGKNRKNELFYTLLTFVIDVYMSPDM